MIRTKLLVTCFSAAFSAAVFLGSGAPLVAAEPEPLPRPPAPIDWRDFVDTDMTGDHVVGEELCAAPGAPESLPDSFVII